MSIYARVNAFGNHLPVETSTFPGGEEYVRVTDYVGQPGFVDIKAHIQSSSDVMKLVMFVDAFRRVARPEAPVYLTIPYMPYARQDRVCMKGESLSIAVFADMINTLHAVKVTTIDPHSIVTGALIKNILIKNIGEVFPPALSLKRPMLIAPDYGAKGRVEILAKKYDLPYLVLNKQRDPVTGRVTFQRPDGPIGLPEEVLVVDDICDGGQTFIELINGIGYTDVPPKLDLWVTHGIFSKGLKPLFDAGYRNIYTTNSWLDSKLPTWDGKKIIPKNFLDRFRMFNV